MGLTSLRVSKKPVIVNDCASHQTFSKRVSAASWRCAGAKPGCVSWYHPSQAHWAELPPPMCCIPRELQPSATPPVVPHSTDPPEKQSSNKRRMQSLLANTTESFLALDQPFAGHMLISAASPGRSVFALNLFLSVMTAGCQCSGVGRSGEG